MTAHKTEGSNEHVWVVLANLPHQPPQIRGVFSSWEKAEEYGRVTFSPEEKWEVDILEHPVDPKGVDPKGPALPEPWRWVDGEAHDDNGSSVGITQWGELQISGKLSKEKLDEMRKSEEIHLAFDRAVAKAVIQYFEEQS